MATSAAAVAAMIVQAVKASGAIVQVLPEGFLAILGRSERPLVVAAYPRFFSPKHQYLTSYKGLAFYTRSLKPLPLPADIELVEAKTIWVPS